MKFKIDLKFGVFLFVVSSIMLLGHADAATQVKLKNQQILSLALAEDSKDAPATVFGGIGRKLPTWQAGLDLLILSNPHYSAFRNQFELSNRAYWGEWWYSDSWGLKGLLSEQTFKMFAQNGNSNLSNTSHLGLLAKTQHSLEDSWKISAGIGLAKTVFILDNQRKLGNSFVTEFRIGNEISTDFWLEGGILTFDSASGNGDTDQRLGSTAYLLGLSYGF